MAGRAGHGQRAADGCEAICQSTETGAAGRVGATATVIGDRDYESMAILDDVNVCLGRDGVARDIR